MIKTRVALSVLLGSLLLATGNARADICVYKPLKVRQIIGVIVDPDGRPVLDAEVLIFKDDLQIAEQQSKEDGSFRFDSLGAGKYEIRAKARGFAAADYELVLYKPKISSRRMIRIELDVGRVSGCGGDIMLVKTSRGGR